MDVVELTQQLVRIPSFVSPLNSEFAIGRYIAELLRADSRLNVTTHSVTGDRYNVMATTTGTPSLLLAGHMDTVPVVNGWSVDPFAADIADGYLYGLGALDMKGGIAAIVSAVLSASALPPGLQLLFYCDEEYDFGGMKSYLSGVLQPPQLSIIAEPSDGAIWNSHRGIVELVLRVTGISAHASQPDLGRNAIVGAIAACQNLQVELLDMRSELLGVSSVNIAGVKGGLLLDESVIVQPNAVADYAEVTLDIRTSAPSIDATLLSRLIVRLVGDEGCVVESIEVRHDLRALTTSPAELNELESSIKTAGLPLRYLDGKTQGYGDGQMLRQQFGVPVANYGPAGDGMHSANERVSIASLYETKRVYAELLSRFRYGRD